MHISSTTRRAAPGALALLLLLASACGTSDAPGPLEPSGPVGRVRFVNLINDPARNPVNALLERLPFGVDLVYGAATPATLPSPSTAAYAAVLAGDRSILVKRTADTSVALATLPFTVADGRDQSVYATGGAGGGAVTAFVTADTNPVAAPAQTRLRLVQLSPTAGAVDVFLTAPGADLAAATPVAANLAYRAVSPYFSFAPGTYQLRAVPAGTAPASRAASIALDFQDLALPTGAARTIVTADREAGGAPLRALVLVDR